MNPSVYRYEPRPMALRKRCAVGGLHPFAYAGLISGWARRPPYWERSPGRRSTWPPTRSYLLSELSADHRP